MAAIVAAARPVRVSKPDGKGVDGRSVLRVLGLGIHGSEEVELSLETDGGDAAADAALLDQLLELLGAAGHEVSPIDGGHVLVGVSASPGAAAGVVERMAARAAPRPAEPEETPRSPKPGAGRARCRRHRLPHAPHDDRRRSGGAAGRGDHGRRSRAAR